MKIWHSYASEHSAKLVIVGTFKSASDTDEAMRLISETAEHAQRDVDRGVLSFDRPATKYSDEMLDFLMNNRLASFGYNDALQLLWDFSVAKEDNRIVIRTDETEIQAIVKIFLSRGAAIEMFSLHDHPERRHAI